MTSRSPSEPAGGGVTGAAQFEGRTAEEAVARARAALGPSSDLRCWKTRRGGVAGFFATEVFVASLTPPPGSEAVAGSKPPTRKSRSRRGAAPSAAPGPRADRAPGYGPTGPDDLLSGLVEATCDEVSLRSVAIPPEAFDEVLAEAEAALARDPDAHGGATGPPVPAPATPADPRAVDEEADTPGGGPPLSDGRTGTGAARSGADAGRAPAEKVKRPTRPAPTSRGTPPARRSAAPAASREDRHVPDLRAALLALGLPDAYLPRGQRPSLDALVRAMGRLPAAPALPTGEGAVVAVVGAHPQLDRTIDLVAAELSLGPRDVLRIDDSFALGRQVARRRSRGRTSLVAVDAGPGTLPARAHEPLAQSAPDYVLAAVGAQSKRVDVEHWSGGLLSADALALWDLAATRTPAELLGMVPIAFVDGEPSSPLGWTLTLAGRAGERHR